MRAIEYQSWGRQPRAAQQVLRLRHRTDNLSAASAQLKWLPYGNGRSYGDCCLNDCGLLIDARGLDRFIAFDPSTGLLSCESGVTLGEILQLTVPRNWFLPVTPGTQFVTVGGAIANDVHGKNHHVRGTFGNHVTRFALLRSDGEVRVCSPHANAELFRATIGGLGLTGLILWAEIQLRPIASPDVDVACIKFDSLDAFFELSLQSDRTHEYTVAWIDCLFRGQGGGRGHFLRGDHAPALTDGTPPRREPRPLPFPVELPVSLVNSATLQLFNTAYFHRQRAPEARYREHLRLFFYPLDGILNWNRIYGRRGLFQFQSVVPPRAAADAVKAMMQTIAGARQGSFLAVLKNFGDVTSPGLLSFPRPGATLALDFPNSGSATIALLQRLEAIVLEAGGALYPAKDACMSPEAFRRSFPRLDEFIPHIDPQYSSSMWRRLHG